MNFFTKNRILVGAVILLAAINIAVLATLGFHSIRSKEAITEQPKPPARGKMVAKELNLTPEQEVQFEELRRDYARQTQEIRLKIRDKYKEVMVELGSPEPSRDALDSIANTIGLLHKQQQQATIEHFLSLREICSYEQYQQLEMLFRRMMSREHMHRKEILQRRQERIEKRRRIKDTTE